MMLQFAGRVVILSLLPVLVISAALFKSPAFAGLNRRYFSKLLVWGIIVLIPATILVYVTSSYIKGAIPGWEYLYPFAGVALIEETAKLSIVLLVLYRNSLLQTREDAVGYSIAIALGFSLAENILYLTASAAPLSLILLRGITAVPLHSLCGAYMGYYTAKAKRKEMGFHPLSLLVPVAIHGLYNTFLDFTGLWQYLIFLLMSGAYYILLKFAHRPENN